MFQNRSNGYRSDRQGSDRPRGGNGGGDRPNRPKGPYCQSCAMPLSKPEKFGTNADGSKNGDYCHFCFQNGTFTDPDITMEQMISKVASLLTKFRGIPEHQARERAQTFIPKLKRWNP
jgi:hypothetical protein